MHQAAEQLERAQASAVRANDWGLASEALEFLSGLAWIDCDGERTAEYARRAASLALPADEPEAFRLCVRRAFHALQQGHPTAARDVIGQAELASRFACVDTFAAYLSVKADVSAALGQCETALGYAELAADIAAQRSDRGALWLRLLYLGHVRHSCGHFADALEAYRRAERIAQEEELAWELPFSRVRAAWPAFLLGRMNEARDLLWASFAADEPLAWLTVTRSWVGLSVGRAAADHELVARSADEAALALALESGDCYSIVPCVTAFAEYYIECGRREQAEQLLRTGLAHVASPDFGWPIFGAVAAYGDETSIARARAAMNTFPSAHRVAQAHRLFFEAVLGVRRGEAGASERNAAEAQMIFEELGCTYLAARCLEVGGHVNYARRQYAAIGAYGHAEQLASACVRRGRPPQGYALARQRREVCKLLLASATNTEIAERLGVCAGTVKNRVREIYEEAGVRTRADLLKRHRS